MIDLYWQFPAWAEKPLVLTNWLAVLILIMVVGTLYQIGKTLNEIHVTIVKIANRFLEGKDEN
jgi:hypothetical protein